MYPLRTRTVQFTVISEQNVCKFNDFNLFQLSVVTDVPALDLVLEQLDNLDNLSNMSDIIDLLFYVLVRLKEPTLKTVPADVVCVY